MKPILFNTEMVQAILEGGKTVTRRLVKPQPLSKLAYTHMGYKHGTWGYPDSEAWKYWNDESFRLPDGLSEVERERRWTPPCHTGDILYVRETWARYHDYYLFKAGCADTDFMLSQPGVTVKWHPSIHMPKEAARIFLRVKYVGVGRLQSCGNAEARDEGCACLEHLKWLWNSTIKPADLDRYGWVANPWVWVVDFERCEKPEDEK